jgi:acetylornithine/succinyldiaminopimelate/putrescine aminotransferase
MPISACIGLEEVFAAWPASKGEALHTQTFLGHPASCAAAIASLDIADRWQLAERARGLGRLALDTLRSLLVGLETVREVRGLGLMLGIECASPEISIAASTAMLSQGYVLLPSGEDGRVLSLTPPLVISEQALVSACRELARQLGAVKQRDQDPK